MTRRLVLGCLGAAACACSVHLEDVSALACDDAHPCEAGQECDDGACAFVSCDLYAGPAGSDGSPGTQAQPFATVQHLADALTPGQTGCLLQGTFVGDVNVGHAGAPGAPISLRSAPGQVATVQGGVLSTPLATLWNLRHLVFVGTNLTEPAVSFQGADMALTDSDVSSQSPYGCVAIGGGQACEPADRGLVAHNRIHDCGAGTANAAVGVTVRWGGGIRVLDNWVYDTVDQGLLLYPGPTNALISGNVVDRAGNGLVFGGDYGMAADGCLAYGNVFANSTAQNVTSSYATTNPAGQGNALVGNCVYMGGQGDIVPGSRGGFDAGDNLIGDPGFVDEASRDLRLKEGSPCAWLAGDLRFP